MAQDIFSRAANPGIDFTNPNLSVADLQNFLNPQPEVKDKRFELPNGEVVSYPGTMSDAEIDADIKEKYADILPKKKTITLRDQTKLEFDIKTPDEEIEAKLREDYPEIYEKPLEPKKGFKRAFDRGIDTLQMTPLSWASSAAELVGLESASEYLSYKAGQQRRQQMNKPLASKDLLEAEGLGDAYDSVKAIIGETLPSTAALLGLTVAGAAAAPLLGVSSLALGTITGFIGASILGTGAVRESVKHELREQGLPDATTGSAGTELLFGAGQGALEQVGTLIAFAPVLKPFIKKFGEKATKKEFSKVTGADEKAVDKALEAVGQSTIKTMAKRGAKGLGVGAVAEGITEAGQEMLNAIGTDVALGREPRSLSELKEHLLSAGVAGMVAGGFFGAGAGTVGGYLDSSAEKKKRLAKDEADKKRKQEINNQKTPAKLAENQTITFLDDDGRRVQGFVVPGGINKPDGDTIREVEVMPSEGYSTTKKITPDRIINELSSDPDATYDSEDVKKAANDLITAQDENAPKEQIEALQANLEKEKKKQDYDRRTRLGLPVQDAEEAQYVLTNSFDTMPDQKGGISAISPKNKFAEAANLSSPDLIREANKDRLRQKKIFEEIRQKARTQIKEKDSLQDQNIFNAIAQKSGEEFTVKDISRQLGLTTKEAEQTLKEKLLTLRNRDIVETVSVDFLEKGKAIDKAKLRTGKNFSIYSTESLTFDGAKNYFKNIDPSETNLQLLNTAPRERILEVAKSQIQKKYMNTGLKNAFDKIKDQTYIRDTAKGKSLIELLNDPTFQQAPAKDQAQILEDVQRLNMKPQESVITPDTKQETTRYRADTFQTVIKIGKDRIDVTQDEIDAGFATRKIGGKIRDIPINPTDLILDKQGNTVAGEVISQIFKPTPDLLLPKGSTSKVSNQIGKLVFTRPPAEQRNALDKANFKIAEVFDIPFDSQDSRYVFLANRGGSDGKTFEIIEGKLYGSQEGEASLSSLIEDKKKLADKAEKINDTIISEMITAQEGKGDKGFGNYPESKKLEEMFGFKYAEVNPNVMPEEEVIKLLEKIAKGFGLKKDQYTALSMGGEVSISISQPSGFGTIGWYNRASKELRAGKYDPRIVSSKLNEATVVHELGHALDNYLGVNFGKTGGFDYFKEASTKAAKAAKIKSPWLFNQIDLLGMYGKEYITHGTWKPRSTLNENARVAWESLHSFIMESDFYKRSLKEDVAIKPPDMYYGQPTESFARLLERVMSNKLGFDESIYAGKTVYPEGNELKVATRLVNKLFKSFEKDQIVNKATGQTLTKLKARIEAKPGAKLRIEKSVTELQDITRKLLGTDKLIQFIPTGLKTDEVIGVGRVDETGYYVRGVTFGDMAQVALGFGNADYTTIHESFHIAEEIGLISQPEIKFLDTQTENIKDLIREAKRLAHPTIQKLDENVLFENSKETRAYGLEAYKFLKEIAKQKMDTKSPLNKLFDKVVEFFKKIQNWFTGKGFYSFESIYDDFLYGKYAKTDKELIEIYKDRPYNITNPLFAHSHSYSTPEADVDMGRKLMREVFKFEEKVKRLGDPRNLDDATLNELADQLQELSVIERNIVHPSTLAEKYPDTFGILWSSLESQRQLASSIEDRALKFAKPFLKLDPRSESYKKIAQVLEVTDYYQGTLPRKNQDGSMTLDGVPPIPGREDSGINFEQQLTLTPEEVSIYEGVRESLDGIYEQTMVAFLASLDIKYPGNNFSHSEIIAELRRQQAEKRREGKEEEARLRQHGIDLLTQASTERHPGYFPRTRAGAAGFIVKDQDGKTIHFEAIPDSLLVQAKQALTFGKKAKGPAIDKEKRKQVLEQLQRKFPEAQGFSIKDLNLIKDKQKPGATAKEEFLKELSIMEQVEYYSTNPELQSELSAIVSDMKKRTTEKGFLRFVRTRADENITGFINARNQQTYHREALLQYLQSGSTFAASVQSAPAINGTLSYLKSVAKTKQISNDFIQYMEEQVDYVRSPSDELRLLKAISFTSYLGFNPSSALLNLTQIPQVTAPTLATLDGVRGVKALIKASADAFKLSKVKDVDEYFYNPDKIKDANFLTADEKEYLRGLFAKGIVTPIRNIDAGARFDIEMESQLSRNGFGAPAIKAFRNTVNWAGALFGGVEQLNRISTALAGYRLHRDSPRFRKNLDIHKQGTKYKNVENVTKEMAGEMMVFDTQFLMGKENRPTIARATGFFGPVGVLTTQFLTFVGQYIERIFILGGTALSKEADPLTRKLAMNIMLGTLGTVVMFGGLLGLPFADTFREMFKRISKFFTDREIDVEIVLRELLQESIGTGMTDTLLRGLPRQMGVDLSQRAAFGNPLGIDVLNNELSWLLGPFGSLVTDTITNVKDDIKNDKPIRAAFNLAPLGIRNFIDSFYYVSEGVKAGTGRTIVAPEDLTPIDVGFKAIGFTPSKVAKERELVRAKRYLGTRDKGLRESFTRRMTDKLAKSYRSRISGDMAESQKYQEEFEELVRELAEYNKGRPPEEVVIIQPETLKNRFAIQIAGINSEASLRYTPKLDRAKSMEMRKLYFSD